ncbi:MAG: radical SAM protein [Clostridiales bacterium]|nr:radical SAM protein [Clostridiales bacterium]
MIEKRWDLTKVTDRIQLQAIKQRRPLSCTMELTYRCNFRCRMCYVRMTDSQAAPYGRLRTVEEWLDMARQMRDAGVLYLTLTGGECTQYPGFEQLYEQLALMGFRITIMSNAGAYTDSIREVFRRYPPANVDITLYGGSNETYAAVTGDPRGLDKVMENIRFLQSIRVNVGLNFTMIRQNALDYLKVGKLCQGLGIPYTLITDITRHRHNPSFSDALQCRLTPAERACIACHPPEEATLALENAKELEQELKHFQMPKAPAEALPSETDVCIGSMVSSAIYWNGDMESCISMNGYCCAKPFEIGFEAAWAQLKDQFQETFRRPAVCQACSMKNDCLQNCTARRYEGTGSPHEPDPYTCQYTYLLRLYRARHEVTDIPTDPTCA